MQQTFERRYGEINAFAEQYRLVQNVLYGGMKRRKQDVVMSLTGVAKPSHPSPHFGKIIETSIA